SLPFFRRFSYEEIKRATGGFSRIIGFSVFENSENGSLKDHHNGIVPNMNLAVIYSTYGSATIYSLCFLTLLFLVLSVFPNVEISNIDTSVVMTDDQSICNFSVSHPCLVSINSSNVLLDEKFVAKISEVGLFCSTKSHIASSLNSCARGNICTVLAVTRSCIDKEGKDVVFQLGVLILELITGQSEKEGTDLVLWVQGPDLAHSVSRMIDPDVENSYNSKELRWLLTVARLCTKSRGKQTCSFQQILWFLQRKLEPCIPQSDLVSDDNSESLVESEEDEEESEEAGSEEEKGMTWDQLLDKASREDKEKGDESDSEEE
ncbi:hypothetical protein IFM89_008154, partial [Coptis chinensis]